MTLNRAYDSFGRPLTVSLGSSEIWRASLYDAQGRLVSEQRDGGYVETNREW